MAAATAADSAADSTAEQAVLTWLFFLLLLPLGLGLVGQQLGLGTAAGESVAGTAAGDGLGLLGGESRRLPVLAGWLWLIPGAARRRAAVWRTGSLGH